MANALAQANANDESTKDIVENLEEEPIFPLAPQPQSMAKALAQANANRMKTIEDNMSLSEIVQNRFKKNIRVNKVSTQEQVEKYIIADPTTANLEQHFDGTLDLQVQLDQEME